MKFLIAVVVPFLLLSLPSRAAENEAYRLTANPDASIVVMQKPGAASATFQPRFIIVHSPTDPGLTNKGKVVEPWRKGGPFNYVVPAWNSESDFFRAPGERTVVTANKSSESAGVIKWIFPTGPKLTASLSLPPGGGEPVLSIHFVPEKDGYYSIGYAGAAEVAPDKADWFWQPLLWQQKRFPAKSYLTPEYECPIPVAMLSEAGVMVGIAADPKESPYRMPTFPNSRFGLLVRNEQGNAQPMLFAPVYGGEGSRMKAGKPMNFTMRLIVRKGDWFDNYKSLARDLYGFGDYRENSLCSLNETLDNMVDFVLKDEYSYWYPQYKTNGYQNDAPGFGRQQSAVTALSLAMVRDSRELYDRRAVPTIEYMLSRKGLLYNLEKYDPKQGMGGPVSGMEVDWAALHHMTGGRMSVFSDLIEKSAKKLPAKVGTEPAKTRDEALHNAKDHLNNLIAFYRATGQKQYLQRARMVADDYILYRIEQHATDFRDAGSSFWHEVSPIWDVLLELYDETADQRYLNAAAEGLKEFSGFVYLQPQIPDKAILVNEGGEVRGMKAPEEMVPAWRVSANGLTAECAGTAHSHRGIFMAPYAAYMQRMAFQTGEDFFRDIARSAIVGRYANYPSYAYRHQYTTLIEKPDYPLRPYEQMTFTSEHYNHPMPMCTYLIDFLVSDAFARSKGEIMFPSRYTSTGAYFKNKVYGDRPGTFYGEQGVDLWLPKALLKADNVQVNYLAGFGNGKLYVALMNQSRETVSTTISLNPDLVTVAASAKVGVRQDGEQLPDAAMSAGKIAASVSAKGLTTLVIEGIGPQTQIRQQRPPASPRRVMWDHQEIQSPFGPISATVVSANEQLNSGYVWINAGPDQLKEAVLHYTTSEGRQQIADADCPFEFTFPLSADLESVELQLEAVLHDGGRHRSDPLRLSAKPISAREAAAR